MKLSRNSPGAEGAGRSVIPGDLVYNFTIRTGSVDITTDMADETACRGQGRLRKGPRRQKERSKGSHIKGEEWNEGHLAIAMSLSNVFTGTRAQDEGVVQAILVGNEIVEQIGEDQEGELFVTKTPFYAESGGQIDDKGPFRVSGNVQHGSLRREGQGDLFAHRVIVESDIALRGTGFARSGRRKRKGTAVITRQRTFSVCLESVLGDHVKQSGSLSNPPMRFDLYPFRSLKDERSESRDMVNQKIMDCVPVIINVKP